MNAEIGRKKYGKIKSGQVWKKRDIGMIMTIVSKADSDSYRVCFDTQSKKSSHKIKTMVIYKYYDRLS